MKLPLSVSIISFNEEDNIGRCLESIKDIADEIIVVDSHSTDRTCEIAERYGAKVYTEDWKGHVAQKNSALEKCNNPWVLALDCDEVVSEELKKSIIDAINNPIAEGYEVNRRTYYAGRWINHAWYPDWKLRLVRREKAKWVGTDPHDRLQIDGKIQRLSGDLYHYSYRNVTDHFKRVVTYAVISAEAYMKEERKAGLLEIVFNPLYGFFKHYVLKLGFLDGMQGFIISMSNFFYTFLKYALIWEKKQRQNK
ncbi:MAG: glycosyltransferase family 2 protein [Proteobacteria bacterium]|nr:glycosyltransferase family 2 protein [Pseudomonadota bacterium]